MIEAVLVLICGLAAIYLGAKWLIEGASQLAANLGVRPFIIGITIIGFGTSAPELSLGIIANAENLGSISLGNVIGSNIGNLTYILGLSAIIAPLTLKFDVIRREGLMVLVTLAILFVLSLGGRLEWWGGAILLTVFAVYLFSLLRTLERCNPSSDVTCQFEDIGANIWGRRRALGVTAFGLLLLTVSAQTTVTGAVEIATELGVSRFLIGVTIISIGTTLPEFTIVILAALKKRPDIALGNAFGTVLMNILVVLGIGSMVGGGMDIPLTRFLSGILPMSLITILPIFLILRRGNISRRAGMLMVAIYIGYLAAVIALG